eukprot:9166015-Pyramimonas_sp.AAC.1
MQLLRRRWCFLGPRGRRPRHNQSQERVDVEGNKLSACNPAALLRDQPRVRGAWSSEDCNGDSGERGGAGAQRHAAAHRAAHTQGGTTGTGSVPPRLPDSRESYGGDSEPARVSRPRPLHHSTTLFRDCMATLVSYMWFNRSDTTHGLKVDGLTVDSAETADPHQIRLWTSARKGQKRAALHTVRTMCIPPVACHPRLAALLRFYLHRRLQVYGNRR